MTDTIKAMQSDAKDHNKDVIEKIRKQSAIEDDDRGPQPNLGMDRSQMFRPVARPSLFGAQQRAR
jgi:hypothetical protein